MSIVLKKLKTCLMDVSCYKQVFEGPNQCLFRDKRQKATDIYDVWDVCMGCYPWLVFLLFVWLD